MHPKGEDLASVVVKRVTKSFGNGPVVTDVSLSVRSGTCLGLLGPNGAGKSTTLKVIYGFLSPDSGEIRVGGLDVLRDPREAKRRIGVVPQDDTLDPELTVGQNLLFHGRYFGLAGREARERADHQLEQAGLVEYRNASIGELSSGLRRRLVLARALLSKPSVVVLDEPTRGLDRESRGQFLDLCAEMKEGGATLLLATHELEEAEALCDRAAIMEGGRIVHRGSAAEVLDLARGRNLLASVQGGAV